MTLTTPAGAPAAAALDSMAAVTPAGPQRWSAEEPPCLTGEYLTRWAALKPDQVAHTFIDYLSDRDGVTRTYTWAELDRWTRASAALLGQLASPGDRVAILAASGPEYVVGFLGALRAGLVAVPLFAPDPMGHADRLQLVLADCDPQVLLTTADKHDEVVEFLTGLGADLPPVVCIDDLDGEAGAALAEGFRDVEVDLDDLAYLQYTSGSTRNPAGVELTHRSFTTNALQIMESQSVDPDATTTVSWLPLFHDMGLMLGAIGPVVAGVPAVVIDPVAFVLRPARWVQLLGSYTKTISAAPNFAFDLAAKRTTAQDLDGVDLANAVTVINGAEPVLPGSLRRFAEAFAPYGLRPEALAPSYGLAEATVFVTTTGPTQGPTEFVVDVAALQTGRLAPGGDGPVTTLVASGSPVGQEVAVVDPASGERCLPDHVGEIWVNGDNVARGYWNSPELSAQTFGAAITGVDGSWLRTGDLGAVHDGLLYVTGRMKDLILVDGRNVYPQDIESTVGDADPAIALNRLAAFAVERPGGEAVVVVAEVYRGAADAGQRLDEIERSARRAVSDQHAVALHDFVLVRTDSVPRTSSGKIARAATRAAYLQGTLDRVEAG